MIAATLRRIQIASVLMLGLATQALAAEPAAEHFDVLEFRVLGNTVLPVADVERAVYSYLGPDKTLDDVQGARAALENAYHAAGYGTVFVDIPEQEIVDGIVRLHAAEGHIDRVRVSGARYFSNHRILASLPDLEHGQVPELPALQSQLADVNRQSADRGVTPVLSAGRTPGTVDIELRVRDSLPLHGAVALNDRYTSDTTHLRSVVDLSYGNLFQSFQSLSFEYQTAPTRTADARVLALTYVAPLQSSSNLLAVYGVDTNSDVAAVGTLNVLGKGRILGARFIHTYSGGNLLHNLNFGADYKDFAETINLDEGVSDRTPIRYINWSLQYSLTERGARHQTMYNIGVNFGIRSLVNEESAFKYKRFDAHADYFYLRGGIDQQMSLFGGTSLDARLTAQLTEHPLISNEQFGVGGAETVRGYLESQVLGDLGAAGSLELHGPAWPLWGDRAHNSITLIGFVDGGVVHVLEALPQQENWNTLASTGVGFRVSAFGGLQAAFDWAYPLESEGRVARGDYRLSFQVRYGF